MPHSLHLILPALICATLAGPACNKQFDPANSSEQTKLLNSMQQYVDRVIVASSIRSEISRLYLKSKQTC
jgi:hypothetical protein